MSFFFKKNKLLLLILFFSFLMYSPSLFGFYTHDDFYHLKISHAKNFNDFLDFFNLYKSSGGQLLYRPLTTHVFYFLAWSLFDLNPFGLHLVSFGLFFITLIFVWKLAYELKPSSKFSFLVTLLYATSASHFGHLYYLATEIVLSAVFFPGVYYFVRFVKTGRFSTFFIACLFYILSVLAKENALVMPGVFILLYSVFKKVNSESIGKLIGLMIPFCLFSLLYLYLHFFKYGVVSGEGYTFDFSPIRTLNTIVWYTLWAFNLPEMFLDFIGPGLKINPNLFIYWGEYAKSIFTVFVLLLATLAKILFSHTKTKLVLKTFCFGSIWFMLTILPVLFLPEHKFTFYLTLPLFGVVYILSDILEQAKFNAMFAFVSLWILGACITLSLTYQTNWITQGQKVSRRVNDFFAENKEQMLGKKIIFVDTPADSTLPWSPTNVVRVALSEKNYFEVFFPEISSQIHYIGNGNLPEGTDLYKINSRIFLGY